QVFGEHMRANGQGRIVNVTSLAGQNGGTVASAHYSAAKAGAIMLSKYFALQLAGSGVVVNAISPGPIATAKQRLSAEQIARVESLVPVHRFSEASEIAAAVGLLASDQGGFIVGATLDINGGLLMR
ncbi:MAG: SDR family oxidoreductase, partial [Gammaproteobacteria bacterium]|nr:SDR family oxidoreductase [Gammaproteobacteria bacterium]